MKNTRHALLICLSLFSAGTTLTKNKIITVDPIQLVNGIRFDVLAKYIFAKHHTLGVQSDWALRLYDEHLHVWNNRIEKYPPRNIPNFNCAKKYDAKRGIDDYVRTFTHTLESIKTEGLNSEKSVVPIDKHYILMDGAHRVAACLVHNKKITCKVFYNQRGHMAPARLFRHKRNFVKTGLQEKYLDDMALTYCALKKNTFIISVFPSAKGKHAEIQKILRKYGNIVYEKKVKIDRNTGSVNFIRMLYEGEKWIGNFSNDFHGARAKAPYCFSKRGPVRVFLFESDKDLTELRECKLKIRALFKIGNDSVHINDTHEETMRIAQTVFNANSIHFINNAQTNKMKNFEPRIVRYKKWIQENKLDREQLCLDAYVAEAAYGNADCSEFFVLHREEGLPIDEDNYIIDGNAQLEEQHPDNIIFNPENHFYHRGLKFQCLEKTN